MLLLAIHTRAALDTATTKLSPRSSCLDSWSALPGKWPSRNACQHAHCAGAKATTAHSSNVFNGTLQTRPAAACEPTPLRSLPPAPQR